MPEPSNSQSPPTNYATVSIPLVEMTAKIIEDVNRNTSSVILEAVAAIVSRIGVGPSKGLTVSQAASLLNYSPAKIRDMVNKRLIDSYQTGEGGDIRITETSILAFQKRNQAVVKPRKKKGPPIKQ